MGFFIVIFFIWLLIVSLKLDSYKTLIDKLTKEVDKLAKKLETTNLRIKILQEEIEKITEKLHKTEQYQEVAVEEKIVPNEEEKTIKENIIEASEKIEETEEIVNYEYTPEIDNQDLKKYEKKYTFNSTKVKKENDFENFFLGNAFTVVGAIALIISVGIFMTIIYSIVTPITKTILGFIFGLILIVISNKIGKTDNLKKYSEVLMGTGFSALFITTLCSTVLFKTFSPTACIFIAGIILTLAYIVADKQKTVSMIAISLLGGYLNIFFASEITSSMACGYIIFLNILSVIYTYRNPGKENINIINLGVSLMFIASLISTKGDVSVAYPVILWLVYLVYDLVKNYQNKNTDNRNLLNWINLGVLTIFSLIIFQENKTAIGITLISMAIVYNIVLAYLITKGSDKFKPYLYSMLITILLSIYFLLDGTTRIAAWSLFGILIAYVVKKLDREYLSNWTLVFLAPAITHLFLIKDIFFIENQYTLLFNNRLLAFSFPLISTFGSYLLLKDMNDETTKRVSYIVRFGTISLLYLWFFLEINNFIYEQQVLEGTMKLVPFIIVGIIYSLQMKKLGMTSKINLFEIAGHVVGFVTLITLFITCTNFKPIDSFIPIINTRVLAYISVIGASICYAKWTKSDAFKYLATVLGFMLITFECFDSIDKYHRVDIDYIVSVFWLIYSFIITTIGIMKDKAYLKNVGIITSILTVMRIVFYDMRNVELLYKLFIFILLGAILMIVSYMYNKNRK